MPSHKKVYATRLRKKEEEEIPAVALLKSIDATAYHNMVVKNKIKFERGLHHKYVLIIAEYNRFLAELKAEVQDKLDGMISEVWFQNLIRGKNVLFWK